LISDVLQPPSVGFALATSFVLHHLVSTVISVSLTIAAVILLFFNNLGLSSIENKLDAMLFTLPTVSICVYPCLCAYFSVYAIEEYPILHIGFALLDLSGE
jgi:hypothetical protein